MAERPLQVTFRFEGMSAIQCLLCGHTSHNRTDVKQRYCGHCNVYHDDFLLFQKHGFHTLRKLKDGRVVGIAEHGLWPAIYVLSPAHMGGDRWIYDSEEEAVAAITTWDHGIDPPGKFRKAKIDL